MGNQLVPNSSTVSTVGGVTSLKFGRTLTPPGQNPIDPTKPFLLLWGFGTIKGTEFEYHQKNRGDFIVDLTNNGNCPAAATSTPAVVPPGKGKKGKGKGKKCPQGQVVCNPKHQAMGNNCQLGKCVAAQAPCANGQIPCTTAMQAKGNNCMVGRCVAAPRP